MKERIPCSRQRASLLMGDNSRVLRWPSRNGLHWRPVVDWRESATALPRLAPEEARLVARPQIRISWSTRRAYFECAGRKAWKRSPTTFRSAKSTLQCCLTLFGSRSSAREAKGYYEIAQAGAGRARGVFNHSQHRSKYTARVCPASRRSRAIPGVVTKRSQAQLACLLMRARIIKRYNLFPRAGYTSCRDATALEPVAD